MSAREVLALRQALLELTDSLPPVQVQNRLMAATDRDIGLSLMGADPDAVDRVLRRVSAAKAQRVREEIRLESGRHVESAHVATALRTLIASLRSERPVRGQRSYLRPRRHNA